MPQNNHRQNSNNQSRRTLPRRPAVKRRRRRKKSLLPNVLLGVFLAVFIVAIVMLFQGADIFSNEENTNGSSDTTQSESSESASESTAESASESTAESDSTPTSTAQPTPDAQAVAAAALAEDMLSDPYMILINSENPVPENYTVETKVVNASLGRELEVNAADAFLQMQADATNAGLTLLAQSGYRSVSYQTTLYDNETQEYLDQGYTEEEARTKAATVVAVPGYSEHNCGLAVDINTPAFMGLDTGFEDTPEFAWLAENAQNYGFILRYTREDQATTGIIYEPWHWRYVGVENAIAIYESGLCLEDYYDEYLS